VLGAQTGPPGDGEVRTWRDSFTNDTITTLTLMLTGPKGPLPINMAVRTVRPAQAAAGSPVQIRLDFDLSLFVGIPDYRSPHLVFTLGRGTKDEKTSAHDANPRLVVRTAKQVTVPFDAAALSRLAGATTVDGRILGLEFELTPKQRRAIKDFAARSRGREAPARHSQAPAIP